MLNIELKARRRADADDGAIAHAIGAEPRGRLLQTDTYFHVARGRLKLRVTEGRPAELIAYERPDRPGIRGSRWQAVEIDDPAALEAALATSIGVRAVVRKARDLYVWQGVRIHCDEVEGLGRFLEFEAPVEGDRDEEAAREAVAQLAGRFAVRREDRISRSYVDLLLARDAEATGGPARAAPAARPATVSPPAPPVPHVDEAVAEVDLDALAANLRALRARLPDGAAVLAVVKADGYGHGAVSIARTLLREGAAMLGVVTAGEAAALRATGIEAPILALAPIPDDRIQAALEADLRISLADPRQARIVDGEAARLRRKAVVHILLDVGMGRAGLPPEEALRGFRGIRELPHIEVEGLWAHLPCSDEPGEEPSRGQVRRFEEAARAFDRILPVRIRHLAASGGVLRVPESAFDMVRVGIALYGYPPDGGAPETCGLRPVMRVIAPVTFVKRVAPGTPISYGWTWRAPRATSIATVRIGYADGYDRRHSNRGRMAIGGRLHPVVGRVTMDQTLLDVGDDPVRPGDTAVVFGPGGPGADELACSIGTIPYEILTSVGTRVRRVYRGAR